MIDRSTSAACCEIELRTFCRSFCELQLCRGLDLRPELHSFWIPGVSKTECMATDKCNNHYNSQSMTNQPNKLNNLYSLATNCQLNNGTTAVKHRIALGWAVFGKNKRLLTSKRIPLHIKSKIYNPSILGLSV